MKQMENSASRKENKKIPGDKETLTEEETKQHEEEEKRQQAPTPVNNDRNIQGAAWQGPDTVPDANNPQ